MRSSGNEDQIARVSRLRNEGGPQRVWPMAKSSHDLFNMLPYLGLAMWSPEDSKGNGASTSIALGHAHGRACRPVKVGSLT